jgi:predicted nucleic acid-binding protein
VVIVDSTVWVAYLNGRSTRLTTWLDRELDRQRLGITDLILCEVLQGLRGEARATEVRRRLLALEVHSTGGIDLALATAHNDRTLRARGRTPRTTIDGLIATFCLVNGHELLHNDRDYVSYERLLGLRVVHP